MQTEWSTGANDRNVVVGVDPNPTDGEGLAGDAGGAVQADAPTDGTEAEEEAHRSAVDAVDGLLDEVERALARLDDGTYGRCEECGSPIDDARLADSPIERSCGACVIGGTGAAPVPGGGPGDGDAVRTAVGPVGLSAATGHHGD
jgi:RNA polymerase-binding transcription factor DksA